MGERLVGHVGEHRTDRRKTLGEVQAAFDDGCAAFTVDVPANWKEIWCSMMCMQAWVQSIGVSENKEPDGAYTT
jgi:hypothetical protein